MATDSGIFIAIFLMLAVAIILLSDVYVICQSKFSKWKARKSKSHKLKFAKGRWFFKFKSLNRRRKNLLLARQMPTKTYYLLTILATCVGLVLGKIFFTDFFLTICVGLMSAFAPLMFLALQHTKTQRLQFEKLQASMMILNSSYMVTEDFLKTVQDNIDQLEYQKPFKDFLTYVEYIDSNEQVALRRMESQVNNPYFSQWIDVLVLAKEDRSLKYVASSVLDSMADMAQIQMESDTAMFAVWREYFMVLALIFSAPVVFRVLMPDAYVILVTSFVGKTLLVLLLLSVIYSLLAALKINKPIKM